MTSGRTITKSLLLVVLIVTEHVLMVSGHGWMMDPQPRSGGGEGTGNASTQSPCGKTGTNTVTATYVSASSITVTYKRANGHGTNGNVVISYQTGNSTTPDANGFTALKTATMDTSNNNGQSTDVQLPTGVTGNAIIQFHWTAGDGSNWWDCAYVSLVDQGDIANNTICDTNNGGCNANATCIPNAGNTRTCKCKSGFRKVGTGTGNGGCVELPAPFYVKLFVKVSSKIDQNKLTENLAKSIGVTVDRVLYDKSTDNNGVSTIEFSVTANPSTGDTAKAQVLNFRQNVINGSPAIVDSLGVDSVVGIQALSVDNSMVVAGSYNGSGVGSISPQFLVLVLLALFASFF